MPNANRGAVGFQSSEFEQQYDRPSKSQLKTTSDDPGEKKRWRPQLKKNVYEKNVQTAQRTKKYVHAFTFFHMHMNKTSKYMFWKKTTKKVNAYEYENNEHIYGKNKYMHMNMMKQVTGKTS